MKKLHYAELMKMVEAQRAETSFYQIHALNYQGVSYEGKRYSEDLASYILKYLAEGKLKELLLEKSHMESEKEFEKGPIHEKSQTYNPKSKRNEEKIAKRLMEQETVKVSQYEKDTKVVDYQVPVNRVWHSSEGKVDLVLANGKETIIGELKDEDSKESLLRAMIEIYTYKLKIESCPSAKKRFEDCYHHSTIQPAVLFFADEASLPYRDYCGAMQGSMPKLGELAQKLGILFFEIQPKANGEVNPQSWT